MTVSHVGASLGPTSLAEKARLTGDFADWHNLFYRTVWITGTLDIAAVRAAWRRVCRHHDALRRTYVSADEARTHADALSEVEFHTAETDDEAIELMRSFLGTPFSLDGPGFSRIAIVQRSERRYLLGVAMDHIMTDLLSWNRIRADFKEFYDRALAGDTGDVTGVNGYHMFAAEQRRLFSGGWGEERKEFWRSYTDEFGAYPPPFLADAKHTGEYQYKVIDRALPADAKARVEALSRQARVTPFAAVSTGILAGVREVADDPTAGISVTHHGRGLPGTSETAGLFAQTVPLHLGRRVTSPLESVREVFQRTHDVFEYALPLTVAGRAWNEALTGVGRAAAGLYLELNERPRSTYYTPWFTGTEVEYIELSFPGDKVWDETVIVSWNLYETGPRLVAEYNGNYFPDAAVEELLEAAQRFVLSATTA
ncbi:condensation domain-containing protein [Streptomyces canus]|uniref:condensation domain-containing protein n=1 Tax=Streptomyces canus TaxID=58343 RepID=UPI000490FF33|nr:condensation domain-containing protein [Streptomyces canus]